MRKRIALSTSAAVAVLAKPMPHDDPDFDHLIDTMQRHLNEALTNGESLFTTDASGLFQAYLGTFDDPIERQYHNCNNCRHFFERFGGLVTITPEGQTRSVLFDLDGAEVPATYHEAIFKVRSVVHKASVTGVFYSSDTSYGNRYTGIWSHYAVNPLRTFVHSSRVETAFQRSAAKLEDFKTLDRALQEFNGNTLATAVQLLKSDSLYRAEKVLGAAEWLLSLTQLRKAVKGPQRRINVLWRAVAQAPAGFCHPRSSMIGTLLEDIASGMSYETVASRFASKMHPLQYQRPQAAPSAGNIAQAEKLVEKMGIASALRRRLARLDEIPALWVPAVVKPAVRVGGVFGHLTPKGQDKTQQPMHTGSQSITWEKFKRTVLPTATSLEVVFHSYSTHPFVAITTAVDPNAAPILQWDSEELRNPFAWYLYSSGSSPSQWSINSTSVKVTAITEKPPMWFDAEKRFKHQGEGVIFCLNGCRDTRVADLALFPEILKSELHSVRSTIEAFSHKGRMEDAGGGQLASGLLFAPRDRQHPIRIMATTNGVSTEYVLDRWD